MTAAPRCFEPHFKSAQGGNPVGHGNFSSVQLATPSAELGETAPTVAMKCVQKANAENLRRLQAEWGAFQAIREGFGGSSAGSTTPNFAEAHPSIITAFGYYESADEAAIALEFAEHGSLMSLLQKRRSSAATSITTSVISEAEVREVMRQVLTALAITHTAGYAHRDVKPHNVLVTSLTPLRVKLADFGLAKKVGSSNLWARQNSAGDYDFMPPSVREGMREGRTMRRRDYFKSDVYAAGVTMFYLVAGGLPSDADTVALRIPAAGADRWPHVSWRCRECLGALLADADEARPEAQEALGHPWFTEPIPASPASSAPAMIRADSESSGMLRAVSVTHSDLLEAEFASAVHPPTQAGERDGSTDEEDSVRRAR